VLLSLVVMLWPSLPAFGQDDACVKCHKDLAHVKDGHAGLKAGCKTCHVATDGSSVPHKTSGTIPNGLSAAQPQLCLGCHDKPKFAKTTAHSAPAKGCTGCHTAHVSKNEKLLTAEVPDLCYSCHEEKAFKGKFRHKPVAQGDCLDCHDAHSAEHPVMLITAIGVLCLECHASIADEPHLASGFSRRGHPLGNEKGAVIAVDPLRPGKPFYCGSCHHPHAAEFRKFTRLDPKSPDYCQRCHDK